MNRWYRVFWPQKKPVLRTRHEEQVFISQTKAFINIHTFFGFGISIGLTARILVQGELTTSSLAIYLVSVFNFFCLFFNRKYGLYKALNAFFLIAASLAITVRGYNIGGIESTIMYATFCMVAFAYLQFSLKVGLITTFYYGLMAIFFTTLPPPLYTTKPEARALVFITILIFNSGVLFFLLRKNEEISKAFIENERQSLGKSIVARYAHEINNPMTIVSLILKRELKKGNITSKDAQPIIENLDRIKNIVSELLKYSQTKDVSKLVTDNEDSTDILASLTMSEQNAPKN